MTSEYLIKKPPVPTKQATISLIKVRSCSALLRMLLVCIRSYLKSVLAYAFLILDTCHPDTLYLHQQRYKDPWLSFEAQRDPRVKTFGKHSFIALKLTILSVNKIK
jgi:hypothetical protein